MCNSNFPEPALCFITVSVPSNKISPSFPVPSLTFTLSGKLTSALNVCVPVNVLFSPSLEAPVSVPACCATVLYMT